MCMYILYIYIYGYVCVYIYIYICVYIEREREREREREIRAGGATVRQALRKHYAGFPQYTMNNPKP